MEKKLEKEIQLEICEWLESKGIFFWRANNIPVAKYNCGHLQFRTMPKYAPKGLSDIIVLLEGIFYAIEVKGVQKYPSWVRMSKDQEYFQIKVIQNGGKYYMVNSLEDVKDIFNGM